MSPISNRQIIERLEVLRLKLEDEGLYVGANTASLAIDALDLLCRVEWCVVRAKVTTSGLNHLEASSLLDELRAALAPSTSAATSGDAGFKAGLDAAAEYLLACNDYGDRHKAGEIRKLAPPAPAVESAQVKEDWFKVGAKRWTRDGATVQEKRGPIGTAHRVTFDDGRTFNAASLEEAKAYADDRLARLGRNDGGDHV